jgi:hypothetical protein
MSDDLEARIRAELDALAVARQADPVAIPAAGDDDRLAVAHAEIERLREMVRDLAPFLAVWSEQHARHLTLPKGTVHPVHAAMLVRANECGAGLRLVDFQPAPFPSEAGA